MSPSMKISLLALVSAASAVPHYGAHSKFHSAKASGGADYGYGDASTLRAVPTGGWKGGFNSTRVPLATGTGAYDDGKTTTLDETRTSTTTLIKTIYASAVPASNYQATGVAKDNYSQAPQASQCGPATVTVTAKEKVTVTITPGGGYAASSPVVGVSSKVPSNEYGTPSQSFVLASPTPAASSPAASAPAASKPVSSKAQDYPVASNTPLASEAKKQPGYSALPVYSAAPVSSAVPISSPAPAPVSSAPVASSAAPVSSAYPVSSAPAGGNKYSGAKRGLAYNNAGLCKDFGSNFGFGYNWAQVENNDIGTKFIPLMHGPTKGTSSEWLANVDKAVKKGSTAVMGFNEPDHAEQANLSPDAACSAWKEYFNPIAQSHPDVTIIGPSVTNGPAPMGLDWLTRFHTACPDAVVHATNIHFYDIYDSQTITRFKAQVDKAISLYGKPVWVTEFGLNPGSASSDQAAAFLKEAMSYLDSNSNVQGYSWFMVGSGENQLNSASGGLSAVGQVYAGTS